MPHDQRTRSAYIFGAICLQRGVGAALILSHRNIQARQWHLEEILNGSEEAVYRDTLEEVSCL